MILYAICLTLILTSAAAMILLYRKLGDPWLFWTEVVRVGIVALAGVSVNAYLYFG